MDSDSFRLVAAPNRIFPICAATRTLRESNKTKLVSAYLIVRPADDVDEFLGRLARKGLLRDAADADLALELVTEEHRAALEALREGWRERKVGIDDLWEYARVDRVANVMRPYLESLA